MKILIAYYSRTNTTKKAAEALAGFFGADIEEIIDKKDRRGAMGYMLAGRDAMLKKITNIQECRHNPSDYDLVIIGTPVWAGKITPAIRAYINKQANNFKQTAFFVTQGAKPPKHQSVFQDLKELAGKPAAAELQMSTKEVISGEFKNKLEEFAEKIKK